MYLFSEIYTDFSEDTVWMRARIREDLNSLPNFLQPLLDHFVKRRLTLLPSKDQTQQLDPKIGRPVPYSTFWFAKAFDFANKPVSRRLALGMLYSAIATTIRDDLLDHQPSLQLQHATLANTFLNKYYKGFIDLFDSDSSFWYYHAIANNELVKYEIWNLTSQYDHSVDPFSEAFLSESSRYFSAVVMPSLVAVAIISENEKQIPTVIEFLKHFSMGWRVFDDLMDWPKDLTVRDLNHSSILYSVKRSFEDKPDLSEEAVLSMFLNDDFVKKAYGTILDNFRQARDVILPLNCNYLTQFMDEQLSYHTQKRDSHLQTNSEFFNQLNQIIEDSKTRQEQ
jgi:hypothetical protein